MTPGTARRRALAGAAGLLVVSLCWPLADYVEPSLWGLRYQVVDRVRGPVEPMPVTVVDIDEVTEESVRTANRAVMARGVRSAAAAAPKVIALDFVFHAPSEDEEDDQALAAALRRHGAVVLGSNAAPARGGEPGRLRFSFPLLREHAAAEGYPIAHTDALGQIERVMLGGLTQDPRDRSFAIAALELFHERKAWKPRIDAEHHLLLRPKGTQAWEPYRIPLDDENSLLLNFRYRDSFQRERFLDVLEGRIPFKRLRDRILIFGDSTMSGQDLHDTPLAKDVPGAEIQATMISQLLARDWFERLPEQTSLGFLAPLALGVGAASCLHGLGWGLAAATLALALWWLGALAALPLAGQVVPLVAPTTALLVLALPGLIPALPEGEVEDPAAAEAARRQLDEAETLIEDGRFDEAVPRLQAAAERATRHRPKAQYHLAVIMLRKGDTQMVEPLVQHLDLERLEKPELYRLAKMLDEKGQLQTAHEIYERLCVQDLTYRDVRTRLRRVRERLSRFDEESVADMIAQRILDSRYRKVERVGSGGMGFVFRAEDHQAEGRVVALKVLSPFYANHAEVRERFLREARGVAELEHPRLIRIYDVFETNLPYYSMEFLRSRTLKDELEARGPLPAAEVVAIARQVAEGMAFAHGRGIVHRDIKPDNLMLEEGGGVKIIDFGIARFAEAGSMTMTGAVLGTPLYMSPEQAQGHPLDHRSDLYSFAAVLFELLAGRPPYAGMGGNLTGEVPELPADLEVPPALASVVRRCLQRDPAARLQSFQDLTAALAELPGP